MSSITIKKATVEKEDGVVVLPLREYRRLVAASLPAYLLRGTAADDLDGLVEEGLREHLEGKTIVADSLHSALRQYRKEHAR